MLPIGDEVFVERIGGRTTKHAFSLTFRTLSLPDVVERVAGAGFVVDRLLGDYRGGRSTDDSEVWVILARRT